MKVYTKTGDKGETSLVGGSRVLKSDLQIDLYGEVDELNSRIGLLVVHTDDDKAVVLLRKIQSCLFDLGSNLACEEEKKEKFNLPQLAENEVKEIESEIDRINAYLPELKNFILPGGSVASSFAHLCRTSCRRVERLLVGFSSQGELPAFSLEYMNRLSDYFFVLARFLNLQKSVEDIPWKAKG